ncbi:unnamed protein product [Prunus brigantina]
MKVSKLISSLQTYERKHLAPKKNKNVALNVVNKEEDDHQNEEFHGEEFAYLSRQFKKFFKSQNSRVHDLKTQSGTNSKNKYYDLTGGSFKSHSESKSESEENTVALITTVSLDKASKKNDDEGLDIEFVLEKYDDLLADSQKLIK